MATSPFDPAANAPAAAPSRGAPALGLDAPRGAAGPVARLRAAVIGCGRVGGLYADEVRIPGAYTHAEAYRAHPEVSLIAAADPDAEQLERFRARWGVPAIYADPVAMVREAGLDLVSICTPPETHAELCEAALEAGVKAILCEKPLAASAREAAAVAKACRRQGVPLGVDYLRRFDPAHRAIRNFLGAGELGPIQAIRGLYAKGLRNTGSHLVDVLRFFFGEIAAVSAWCSRAGEDAELDMHLRFADGLRAFLHGCDERHFNLLELDLVGAAGRLEILDHGYAFKLSRPGESHQVMVERSLREVPCPFEATLGRALPEAVAALVAALRTGADPPCTGEDGVAALRVIEAAERSARSGGAWIPCAPGATRGDAE